MRTHHLLLPLLVSVVCGDVYRGWGTRQARKNNRRARQLEAREAREQAREAREAREREEKHEREEREEREEGLELLEGAENGRYRVVAKAEPYKNLPPAPVTPSSSFPATPAPRGDPRYPYNWGSRSQEPTPPPMEDLQFAPREEGATKAYVPVRVTPVYNPSTPSYSVTPPAIAFEPTQPQNKSPSTPNPGKFKISVEHGDLIPTPPPPPHIKELLHTQSPNTPLPSPPQFQQQKITKKKEKQKQHKSKSKPDKEIHNKVVSKEHTAKTNTQRSEPQHQNPNPNEPQSEPLVYSPQHKADRQKLRKSSHGSVIQSARSKAHKAKSEMHRTKHEGRGSNPQAQKPTKMHRPKLETEERTRNKNAKQKSVMTELKSRGEGGRQDGRGVGQDVRLNEIEATATSFKKDNYDIISTSIYDPRPRTRSYKKHKIRKGKGPGRGPKAYKGNFRNRNYINQKLPIKKTKNKDYSREKSSSENKYNQKISNFDFNIKEFKVKDKTFETVKRQAQPIFLPVQRPPTTRPAPLLHTPVPSPAGPFTAFTTYSPSPTPTARRPPRPSPGPSLPASDHRRFSSFAPSSFPLRSLPPRPASPQPPPPHHRSAPAPPPTHRSAPAPPAPHHTPPAPHHSAQAPLEILVNEDYMAEIFEARPYSFNFGVDDEYSGVDYKRAESRSDQGVTSGSYSVALPDGRLQTVSYTADDNGFHATVTYKGNPTYGNSLSSTPGNHKKNPYRASSRVEQPNNQQFSPHPPATRYQPKPNRHKNKPYNPPPPTPYQPSPPPPSPYTPAPPLKITPSPAYFSTTPAPASPVTNSHSLPSLYSPSPSHYHSPSPTPYHSPSPSPFYGSPTPTPYSFSPTPAPIFHTTPSYVLGLKASLTPGYIPPTTWKPKYPRILEHTLRSAPSKRSYGSRERKGGVGSDVGEGQEGGEWLDY